ncbi:MAG: hypothetical protein AAF789_11840, partial [Bacteroidota bacterium]
SDIPSSTGIGFQLIENYPSPILWGLVYRAEIEGQINVSTQADDLVVTQGQDGITNQSEIGAAVLTPLIGNQAVNLSARAYLTPMIGRAKGLSTLTSWINGGLISYTGSNRTVVNGNTSVDMTVNSFRAGIFHEFLGLDYRDVHSISLGGAYAFNSIRGDIGQSSFDALRKELFNTSRRSFWGAEIFLHLRFKNIRAKFEYDILSPGVEVPGLTGGRMVTTISFIGGFPIKLK